MKKADNRAFSIYLKRKETENYLSLEHIANSGSGTCGIKKTEFYTTNGYPSDDFFELCENICGELTVYVHSENASFISSVLAKIRTDSKKYKKIAFGVTDPVFFESDVFKRYFVRCDDRIEECTVFGFKGEKRTFSFVTPGNLSVQYVENPAAQPEKYDNAEWDDLQTRIGQGNESDLLTLLFDDGVLCGYLLANNTYGKYYSVSNVFVKPQFRGKGYGTSVIQFFMKYCFIKGFTPQLSTAVSGHSGRSAVNAGLSQTGRLFYADAQVR